MPSSRPRAALAAATALLAAATATTVLTTASASAVAGDPAADGTYAFSAKLVMGDSERACSGSLVAPQWIATAASCFAADPQQPGAVTAGKPAWKTTATVGRTDLTSTTGVVSEVVEIVPYEGRDLVLARLARPATGIVPLPLTSAAPAAGESLKAAGYGRTKTQWVPDKLHSSAFTVDGAPAAGSVGLVGAGTASAICAGDTGGPVIRETNGQAELVAVSSLSWQGGCLGSDETRTGAVATRVDDLGAWISSKVNATRVTDFNCDGVEDIAVGDAKASVNGQSGAGLVRVVYGAGKGTVALHQDVEGVPDAAEAGDWFGEELAVFDHNEDGCTDLAVGVPSEDIGTVANAGLVTILYGSRDGLGKGTAASSLQQGTGSGAVKENASVADDRMGDALAAGHTAAGEPYLVIGVPGKNLKGHVDAGLVFYLRGTANVSIHQDDPGVVDVIEDGDRFGASVTGSPNHLAIGAPGEAVGTAANAGLVTAMEHKLSADNIPTPVASIGQGAGGVSDAAEPGDRFGESLSMAAYRPSGATAADSVLAVGTPGETLWVGSTSFADAGQVTTLRVSAAGAVTQLATIHQGVAGVNGASATGDEFGAQVSAANTAPNATGTASTMLLAVGVPGKDIGTVTDAGIVQTFSLLGEPGDSDHWIEAGNERGLPGTPGASQLVGNYLNATGTHLWIGMPNGPAERGAVHGLPWSNAMGGTDGTVTTHQPGQNGLPLTGNAFGMAIR